MICWRLLVINDNLIRLNYSSQLLQFELHNNVINFKIYMKIFTIMMKMVVCYWIFNKSISNKLQDQAKIYGKSGKFEDTRTSKTLGIQASFWQINILGWIVTIKNCSNKCIPSTSGIDKFRWWYLLSCPNK